MGVDIVGDATQPQVVEGVSSDGSWRASSRGGTVFVRASRRLVTLLILGSMVLLSAELVASPASATAVDCTTASNHAWTGGSWFPTGTNFAAGVQAPIQFRTASRVCNSGGIGEPDGSSAWIAIVNGQGGNLIAQIGFLKLVTNFSTGDVSNCRFWAHGTGQAHSYKCGDDSDGDRFWFRIEALPDPDQPLHPEVYALEDCGTSGGYGSCITKDFTQQAWSNGVGYTLNEVGYACDDKVMGSSSSRVNYGIGTYPIKGQNSFGGAWAIHDWAGFDLIQSGTFCNHYFHSVWANDEIVQTWDSQN